jgi:hypothetical protein
MAKAQKETYPEHHMVEVFIETYGEEIKKLILKTERPFTYPLKDILPQRFLNITNPIAHEKAYGKKSFGNFAVDVSTFVKHMGPLIDFLNKHGCQSNAIKVRVSKTEDPYLIITQ